MAHTYTTTTVYSRTSRQSIKSQIVVPTHAGPYGDAPLACNTADFCGELDERLHALNTTLRGVHEDVHAKLTLQQETITKPTLDRCDCRKEMNCSIARQMELLTSAWSGFCQPQQ